MAWNGTGWRLVKTPSAAKMWGTVGEVEMFLNLRPVF